MLFLHVSDIHFKAPECLNPDTDPDRGIERHLATQIPKLGKVDAILIGGDVAFAGDLHRCRLLNRGTHLKLFRQNWCPQI